MKESDDPMFEAEMWSVVIYQVGPNERPLSLTETLSRNVTRILEVGWRTMILMTMLNLVVMMLMKCSLDT